MLIGFVQGYEELKWGISKLNPLCNGPLSGSKRVRPIPVLVTLYGTDTPLCIEILYCIQLKFH